MDAAFDGGPIDIHPGDDPMGAACASLQAVACATISPALRLRYGFTDSRAAARHLAPAVASAYGLDPADLAGEWARRYGHDLGHLDQLIRSATPPRCLTPEEVVDGL